ncbi:MAG TPA: O-antigen ligase family protein [Pyrinomonadaceae bacterium]|nr:O-antigen ligase family protein [Pyrinomonadaceae bacterium]
MQLERIGIGTSIGRPTLWFVVGLAVAMLALWFPFIPNWQTFIHMWRVEIAASVVLLGALTFFLLRSRSLDLRLGFTPEELRLIVLPIAAFILWSAVSATWSPSWKSAIHHSLIWIEYLAFYLIFRYMLERDSHFRVLSLMFVVTIVLYALPAIFEYCAFLVFGGTTTLGTRFAKYGEQVVTLVPLITLGVIRTTGRRFAIGAAIVAVMWLLIFCSFGRVNYLLFASVMIALLAAVAISNRYRRYAPRFALLFVILVLAPLPLHVFSFFSAASVEVPVLNRVTDSKSLNSSNGFRKLMISLSGEMIRENPILGIGADNFGLQVNGYRQRYGAANPADVNLTNAEDQIPSHAHNEFLQIAAELGAVGIAIFSWLLVGIAVLAYRSVKQIRTGSLYPFAAVLGIGAFLASSAVSAYSFRVMQNGIVFFFVLAVAVKMTFRPDAKERADATVVLKGGKLRLACLVGVLACVCLTLYSTVRVVSVAATARANTTRKLADAAPLYELAMTLDDENPNAHRDYGMRFFRRERYAEAIPYLRSAVEIGRAPSSDISYLATAQTLSGDNTGAEATIKMASELYPRSTFVLTRYAALLEGRNDTGAVPLFERASAIDRRQAAAWRVVLTSGPKELSEAAGRDYNSYLHISELLPQSSLYAVVTERYIRFPDEQRFSLFKIVKEED